jgi:hypothetical protein
LHLLAAHETKRLPGNGGICVFVKDVDRVHADLTSRGANVIRAPQNYDYGMRDFDVVDLDVAITSHSEWNPSHQADVSLRSKGDIAT